MQGTQNYFTVMGGVSGGVFDILDPNITVEGLENGSALAAGIPEGQESDEWRKVDVEINGRLVLRRQG